MIWLDDEIITMWESGTGCVLVTALHVISVIQLTSTYCTFQFDTKKKSVHIYNIFSSDFVYKSCILA